MGISAVIFAILVGILNATVIDFWTVPDDEVLATSIAPTLGAGDLVIVAKEQVPDVPSLVRCTDPDYPDRFVIARVVARSDEELKITHDIANAKHRREPSPRTCDVPEIEMAAPNGGAKRYLTCREENYDGSGFKILVNSGPAEPDLAVTVDTGMFFLVSDNRAMHLDSRDFGQVVPSSCRRIYFRLWGREGVTNPYFRWVF